MAARLPIVQQSERSQFVREWLDRNREIWPRRGAMGGDYKRIIDKAREDGIWSRNTSRTTIRLLIEKILLEYEIDRKVGNCGIGRSAANDEGNK